MNKTYFRIRCIIAWVTGILCFLAFFSAFYPVKIFDLQLTALLQRFLVDVSLTAAILLSALLLLTLFFGRVYCSTLCPFGLLQEFLMLFFRRRTGYRQNRPAKYFLAAVFFGMLLGGTVAVIRLPDWLLSDSLPFRPGFLDVFFAPTSVRSEPSSACLPSMPVKKF